MPLAQFAHTVDDFITGVIVQPFCHSKVVLPGGQRLLAAAIKILFLPFQIISDLHQAHAVCNKDQVPGTDPFFFAPTQHFIRDTLSGPLLKLQPGQSLCVSVQLAQAAEFGRIKAQSSDQSRLVRMQNQFPHTITGVEALVGQPRQSSLPDLLHLGKFFPYRQVFFRISDWMASYPLNQAGLAKFFSPQARQSLSIHPARLIPAIVVIAGASLDPAHFSLAVHSPEIGTDLSAAVINRTPELMPIRFAMRKNVFPVGPVRPEFSDDKPILTPLDEVSIMLLRLKIASAAQRLENNGMPTADATPLFVVVGMPRNGHLLPAEGAVADFGSAALVLVKYKIFSHGHLVSPTAPVFRQFRHLSKIFVPRVGDPLMTPLQLFFPHFSLKIEDAGVPAPFAGKIPLHHIRVFCANPANRSIILSRPF